MLPHEKKKRCKTQQHQQHLLWHLRCNAKDTILWSDLVFPLELLAIRIANKHWNWCELKMTRHWKISHEWARVDMWEQVVAQASPLQFQRTTKLFHCEFTFLCEWWRVCQNQKNSQIHGSWCQKSPFNSSSFSQTVRRLFLLSISSSSSWVMAIVIPQTSGARNPARARRGNKSVFVQTFRLVLKCISIGPLDVTSGWTHAEVSFLTSQNDTHKNHSIRNFSTDFDFASAFVHNNCTDHKKCESPIYLLLLTEKSQHQDFDFLSHIVTLCKFVCQCFAICTMSCPESCLKLLHSRFQQIWFHLCTHTVTDHWWPSFPCETIWCEVLVNFSEFCTCSRHAVSRFCKSTWTLVHWPNKSQMHEQCRSKTILLSSTWTKDHFHQAIQAFANLWPKQWFTNNGNQLLLFWGDWLLGSPTESQSKFPTIFTFSEQAHFNVSFWGNVRGKWFPWQKCTPTASFWGEQKRNGFPSWPCMMNDGWRDDWQIQSTARHRDVEWSQTCCWRFVSLRWIWIRKNDKEYDSGERRVSKESLNVAACFLESRMLALIMFHIFAWHANRTSGVW